MGNPTRWCWRRCGGEIPLIQGWKMQVQFTVHLDENGVHELKTSPCAGNAQTLVDPVENNVPVVSSLSSRTAVLTVGCVR